MESNIEVSGLQSWTLFRFNKPRLSALRTYAVGGLSIVLQPQNAVSNSSEIDYEVGRLLSQQRFAHLRPKRLQIAVVQCHHSAVRLKFERLFQTLLCGFDFAELSEQGSQKLQGDVQEMELEKALRERFPRDQIEPVKVARAAPTFCKKS